MSDHSLALTPASLVSVETTAAGASHLVAWTAQQRATAVHEVGHAVVARVLGVPVKSVSIKERSGGLLQEDRDVDDRNAFTTWQQQLDRVAVALAGLAVTEVALGQRMSGAHLDMRMATVDLIGAMEGGMDPDPSTPFIGSTTKYEQSAGGWLADARNRRIEILLREQYQRALDLCERHRDHVVAFATILFERRRLSDEALEATFREIGL